MILNHYLYIRKIMYFTKEKKIRCNIPRGIFFPSERLHLLLKTIHIIIYSAFLPRCGTRPYELGTQ